MMHPEDGPFYRADFPDNAAIRKFVRRQLGMEEDLEFTPDLPSGDVVEFIPQADIPIVILDGVFTLAQIESIAWCLRRMVQRP